jgi:hypothetical protein
VIAVPSISASTVEPELEAGPAFAGAALEGAGEDAGREQAPATSGSAARKARAGREKAIPTGYAESQ